MAGTRVRIVAATNELFRRSGYNGTSLKQVTMAAQAPIGSLYHFFPGGKAELAEAVIVETGASYRELFELIASGATDPAAAVSEFFDGAAETLEQSDYLDVCPIGTVAREVASTNDRLRTAADDAFTSWIEAVAAYLQASGLAPTQARTLATTIVAALEGGFILARTHQDGDVLRDIGRHMRHAVATELLDAVPHAAIH